MIPQAKDTRESLGEFAEKVENRSLLFAKMVLSKSTLHQVERFDDAQRYNVLRATHEGNAVLQQESAAARATANSERAREDNRAKAAYKARVAQALTGVKVDHPDLTQARIKGHVRFLLDLEKSYGETSATFVATLGGRLLINMAGGVMENSGLSLDRMTGLPMIPGSAVKGVTRHQALWDIRREQDQTQKVLKLRMALAIFGFSDVDLKANGDFLWAAEENRNTLQNALEGFETDAYKGVCAFLAAHPNDHRQLRIVAEVLTPHNKGTLRPIFFPAVEAGSTFGFAIIAQRDCHLGDLTGALLLRVAKTWLLEALQDNGIGAKTGAGYGWFKFDPQAEEKRNKELDLERHQQAKAEADRQLQAEKFKQDAIQAAEKEQRRAKLSPVELEIESIQALNDDAFATYVKTLAEKTEDQQRALIAVILSPAKKEKRKTWKKRKPELIAIIESCAKTLNLNVN